MELVGDRLTIYHDQPRTQSVELLTLDGIPVCTRRATYVRGEDETDFREDDGSESWVGPEWTGRTVFTLPQGGLLDFLRNPVNATGIIPIVLGPVHLAAVSNGDVKIAFPIKLHPTCKVPAGVRAG